MLKVVDNYLHNYIGVILVEKLPAVFESVTIIKNKGSVKFSVRANQSRNHQY